MKDAEATLCGTWERCLAFEAAMGRAVPGATSVGGGMGDAGGGLVRRPLVLLAGCGFSDSANQSASQARCRTANIRNHLISFARRSKPAGLPFCEH